MVPSQEEPAAARGPSEAQPPGPAPPGAAPLPGPGPLDGPEAAGAEKVEVELAGPAGPAGPAGVEPLEPPEGGWGWLVMLAAMWCNGSVFGIQNACGVLFVSMLKTFGSKDDDKMVFKTGEAQHPPRPSPRGLARGPPGIRVRSERRRRLVRLCGSVCAEVVRGGSVQLQKQHARCACLCVESRCRHCIWKQVAKLICLDLPAFLSAE